MSIEDLRRDLKSNLAEVSKIGDGAVARHLRDTLWPFLEAMLDDVEEMDDAVGELVQQQEDYLQAETATNFVALVQLGRQIAAELAKRASGEEDALRMCGAYEKLAIDAMGVLEQITVMPSDESASDDNADEDADEDADDEEGDDE